MPTCIICGLPFHPTPRRGGRAQVTCLSKSCTQENKRRLMLSHQTCEDCHKPMKSKGRLCKECQSRVDAFRAKQEAKKGVVKCLKCDREFKSPDKKAVRICTDCKDNVRNFGVYQPQEVW